MSIPQEGGGSIEHHADLVTYLADGCKPPSAFRIGTEHEKLAFAWKNVRPLPYEGEASIRALLEGLMAFGWEGVYEGETLIGLKKDGASVSLEPGGQFELSGAPLDNLHQTCDEVHTHLAQVKAVADPLGIGFLGIGVAPHWSRAEVPMMPKGRYRIMSGYMSKRGDRGLDMMLRTCTIQVNLDFSSEADMVKKLRVGLALQPIATALFANSPFIDGRLSGALSTRSLIWTDTDPDRTGDLPFVFEDGFGFERYADYALDVPMYFVYRGGRYHDVSGQSFRDFMEGRLPGLEGETPTLGDWADHLTTIFPDARLKRFIEMRGADGGPWGRICALPAFWAGLLYEQSSLDAAWDLACHWTAAERAKLRLDVITQGLGATIRGRSVRDIARELLDYADAGLRQRRRADKSPDERLFLDPLVEIVEEGRTPAERLIARWKGEWGGDFAALFRDEAY
ncbi:MAG: glutamate--cysteine ligase [Alphaproteobacteria bacterium]|nr:glutamate--cysteine ligase [Alphaproteobacteria bacterium]